MSEPSPAAPPAPGLPPTKREDDGRPSRSPAPPRDRSRSPPRRPPSPALSSYRIYVGNIPFKFRQDDLEDLFRPCGRVLDTKVVMDRDSGRSKGFGFVTFDTEAGCERAIRELDRSIHDSRAISVTHAHNKGPSGGPYNDGPSHYDDHPRRARTPTEQKFRITLGGLPSQMDWKDVKDFLRDFGEVTYTVQKANGDWFADFRSESDMRAAVSDLDGKEYQRAFLHARMENHRPGPPPGRSRSPYDSRPPPPRYRDDYRDDRRPDPRDRYDDRGYDRRPPPPRDAFEPAPLPPRREEPRYRDYDRPPPPRDFDDRGSRYAADRSGGRGGRYSPEPLPPPPPNYRDDYRGREEPRGRPRDDRYDYDRAPLARGPPPPARGGSSSYAPDRHYADPLEHLPPPRSRHSDDYPRDRFPERSPAKRGPPLDDYSPRDRDYRPPRREDDYPRQPPRGAPPPRDNYREYAY